MPSENSAPTNACVFADLGQATFADGDGPGGFKIVGYSGEIIKNHWYWGNLAFDLAGVKFDKPRTPVLEDHFTSQRIGFTTEQSIGEKVTVEGQFLRNQRAQELASDIKDGFPMQASLFIPPSVVERVEEGASVEVNGKKLKGPGHVFRKATIKEVSMCVFGADGNTKSAALAEDHRQEVTFAHQKGHIMADKSETMTVETFADQHPQVYQTVFERGQAEGRQAERTTFGELVEACGEDLELLVGCYREGTDPKEAMRQRISKLQEANKQLQQQPAKAPDPAVAEFSDDQGAEPKAEQQGPSTFMEAVAQYKDKHQCSEAEAVDKCASLYPELHEKMRRGE